MGQEGGREEGGEWRRRSAEVGTEEGLSTSDRWYRETKRRVGKVGRTLVTCLKIKVLSWPWLIFHHTLKLKM